MLSVGKTSFNEKQILWENFYTKMTLRPLFMNCLTRFLMLILRQNRYPNYNFQHDLCNELLEYEANLPLYYLRGSLKMDGLGLNMGDLSINISE